MTRVFALLSAGLWVLLMLTPIACGDPDRHGLCQGQSCSGHGACAERDGSPFCFCDSGFIAEGLACLVDPCAGMVCVHGACDGGSCVCEAGYAGALCDACAEGYHSDLLTCQPDSPCDELACVHGRCRLVDGQPICDCDSGYRGALCDVCAEGFHPEGLVCIVDSPCDPDPCVHGACEPVEGEAQCACEAMYAGERCDVCAEGFVPSGLACIPIQGSVCDPNPCDQAHRSICEVIGDAYACACDPGFHDEAGLCLPDPIDPCNPNPCLQPNRGVCAPDGDGFTCACDSNYQDHDGDGTCFPGCAASGLTCPDGEICADDSGLAICVAGTRPPIYIAFHWHMHQPVYWPYESVVDTEANNRMGYSVYAIHHDRSGPYSTWPRDAVNAGQHLSHLGAQVSFSGSLMENLNNLAGAGAWSGGWQTPWIEANGWDTSLGNPRLDLVRFGYHHPLMGLIDSRDMQLQLQAHDEAVARNFGSVRSKGIFPPECAFSERLIPALVAEGIEWALVDNIHFDRAHLDYPWVPESNLPVPNPADQLNDAPTDWVQLNNLWAPSRVAAPWGYRPHWVEHHDPDTGIATRMIAVPAARYEGNEDGRGGFGALQYESVMSQYEHLNTDPDHPMLVVLHHDGDNYGGGTDSYYHANFGNFVAWVQSQPERFVATTVQDYLDSFPPDPSDVIHVEDGSWAGADNGDPEFSKWNGDPDLNGHSPDRNSWSVLTAVKNRVLTAEANLPLSSIGAVLDGTGNDTDLAWHYLLNAETSCYWYWDYSQDGIWDSHPTRAANLAASHADGVLSANFADPVGPTIYLPQREPYNPGLGNAPSDFSVWTFVYDTSGLSQVRLHLRVDQDGQRDQANCIYAGGTWSQLPMSATSLTPQTDPLPAYQAEGFAVTVTGLSGVLVDYYVSAEDGQGNISRSPLMHVWVAE